MTPPSASATPPASLVIPTTPLIVVTGKGGVGRSTAAAAIAERLARGGARVALAHAADAPPVHTPSSHRVQLRPLDTDAILANYLDANLPGPFAMAIRASRAFRLVTAATPGLAELLMLGELKRLHTEEGFAHVVFDAPATGHLVALIDAPPRFARAAGAGPMARRAEELDAWVREPASTAVVAVTTGDPLAVSELLDLSARLHERLGRMPALVIANRLAPTSPTAKELEALGDVNGLPVGAAEAVRAVAGRARSERAQLGRITRTLGTRPVAVPEDPTAPVEAVVGALPAEAGR